MNHSDTFADSLNVFGKPYEDGKMQATVHGLSTTSSLFPCPICTWHLRQKIVPSWVNHCGRLETVVVCEDCEQRIGEKSLKRCYDIFKLRRGGPTDDANIEMKKDVFSVINEPLLRVDDDKKYKCAPDELHVRQGEEMTAYKLGTFNLNSDDDFTDEMESILNNGFKK